MKFELKPHNRDVSNDELLADLKYVAVKLGKSSLKIEEYATHGRFHNTTFNRRFGSWSEALNKAGLKKERLPAVKLRKRRVASDSDLLNDLKSVVRALGKNTLTMNEYDNSGKFNSETLSRRFGSWSIALEEAGLDSARNILTPRISDDDLIADLKRVAQELHKSSVTTDEYDERGNYSSFTQSHRFGSWFKALAKAGLNKTRNLHIANEELFINMVEVWTRFGQQPAYQDLTSQSSRFSAGTYEKRFGTWRKALEAFVNWANTQESQTATVIPQQTEVSTAKISEQKTFRHRTARTINHRLRFLVMRRDNFRCRITGRSPATDPSVILEVDHIVPWDKGGETVIENLQTLAKEINIGKSNLDMFQND